MMLQILFALLFGLIIGSFLNVVIYRFPQMYSQSFQMSNDLPLDTLYQKTENIVRQSFNLATPRSHCPHCKSSIAWYDNIPLISFILLRGQCRNCKQKISWRYPLVEIITAFLFILLTIKFGISTVTFFSMIFSAILIILAAIDLKHWILPDRLTLSLLWIGLSVNAFHLFTNPQSAILGAILGFGLLWLINLLYYLWRNKDGIGQGDFKLLAALGAWIGFENIPMVLFISAILGSVIGLGLILINKRFHKQSALPFGPFLAFAGWIMLTYF
ncbi:MAG: A24 family peptidase [Gammaproteobacteria bacterium]